MSAKENATGNEGQGIVLSLTRKIMGFLKLDDAGKIDKFLVKIIKDYRQAIDVLKSKIASAEFQLKQKIDILNDKIEDAEAGIDEAYLGIDVERLKTNADQTVYRQEYMGAINEAFDKLESLKKEKEQLEKDHKTTVDSLTKEIEVIETKISRIENVK